MERSLPLAKLHKGREKGGIIVRIVRKWVAKDRNGDGPPLYVGMVIADSWGDAMYAEIPAEIIPVKDYLLEAGLVYLIKKFRVNSSKPFYKPFDGNLMIELTAFTTIELMRNPPATVPQLIYNITPFSAIVPVNGAVFKYTDALGYIVRHTALTMFVPKNKEKATTLREIYLKDFSDTEMKVTLWGQQAAEFSIDHVYDRNVGNLIVCLVVGCLPRSSYTDRSKAFLSGSSACAYYLNPDIPEAKKYHDRFRDKPVYIDCPTPNETVPITCPQDKPLDQKTIAELDSIDPFDFEDGIYKCAVTIVSIPENINWWYRSCVSCKKKAEQQPDHRYRCPKCLGYNIIPRYILSFRASDATGEASFFAFDDEARLIVQKDCDAVIGAVNLSGGLPQPLKKIVGQAFTFGIDLTDDSCKGALTRQYLVKSVLQRPKKQAGSAEPAVLQTPPSHQTSSVPSTPMPTIGVSDQSKVMHVGSSTQTPVPNISPELSPCPTPQIRDSEAVKRKLFTKSTEIEKETGTPVETDTNSDLVPEKVEKVKELCPHTRAKRAKTLARKQGSEDVYDKSEENIGSA